AGRVAAEDHRQPVGGQPHPAQRPQVVVIERAGPHLHRGPLLRCRRSIPLADHQTGERVVRVDRCRVRGAHQRVTPSRTAAACTAAATAGATRGSRALGTIASGRSSSATTPAIAPAAATFMPWVIRVARAARAPRNTPGKASTLLIWLGKSLRPVATIDAYRPATAGCT